MGLFKPQPVHESVMVEINFFTCGHPQVFSFDSDYARLNFKGLLVVMGFGCLGCCEDHFILSAFTKRLCVR